MDFWKKVKKDLRTGIREGITYIKEGAEVAKEKAREGAGVAKEKAGEFTEEAKRKYKIYDLKAEVKRWMAELGGKVYELSEKGKKPMQTASVQATIKRIKKLEAQLVKLEGKVKRPAKKTSPKK